MRTDFTFKKWVGWGIFILLFGLMPIVISSSYQLNLIGHILIWGMFAISFNMLWGVTGMLSFGQALYFGLGAYSVGLMVKYLGVGWYFPGIAIGLLLAVILAFFLGLLITRVSGVYFTMLTLAFGQLAWQVTFKCYNFTGGDDGIVGIIPPGILGESKIAYYYFILATVLLSIWFMQRITHSPFGLMLRCIRQNPERVLFLGRSVRYGQLRIYIISSVFASLAGALMVGVDNFIHTDMFIWTTSGEVILMSVLGGISQFFGPFIGAISLIFIEDIVGAYTEYWSMIIGLIILFIVIILPNGVVGELMSLKQRIMKLRGTGGCDASNT